ncbi:MAG: hypothetical protein IT452_07865 [Planctomycetia bacterium]|nr:hypothetical protein [Planctomycetia bacterium]
MANPMAPRVSAICALCLAATAASLGAEVYLTTDGGETWQKRGPEGLAVLQLVPDPKDPAVAWAIAKPTVAKEGEDLRFAPPAILRTGDAGKTWEKNAAWQGPDPFCIAVDPLDPQVVCVGGTFGRIGRSTDGGKTWGLINLKESCKDADGTPVAVQDDILRICARGERILASGRQRGDRVPGVGRLPVEGDGFVLMSSDSGKSWTRIRRSWSCSFAMAGDRILVADTWGSADESSDGGKTWTSIRKLQDHEIYPSPGYGVFSVSPDGSEVAYWCLGQAMTSRKAGEWTPWPGEDPTKAAERIAWCRPRRVAIFQHGSFDEGGVRRYRHSSKRSLRVCDRDGEWVPVAVPDERTPRLLETACDRSAAWLVAE